MGRGRQKAKQTKVARRLKYYSPDTDYGALQRELGHPDDHDGTQAAPDGMASPGGLDGTGVDGAPVDGVDRDLLPAEDDEDSGYGSWASGEGQGR